MVQSSKTANRSSLIYGSLGILLVAGLIAWGLWPAPEYVEIATISNGQFSETVDEDGVTRIKDIYTVSAPVTGRLLRNDLEVGARVEKLKSVVARIQPAEPAFLDISNMKSAEAGVEGARAAITLAESNLATAIERRRFSQSEYNRGKKNKKKGRITKSVLERIKFDRNLAREAVKTANAKLAIAREDLKIAQARIIRPGPMPVNQKIVNSGSSDQTASQESDAKKSGDKGNKSTKSKNTASSDKKKSAKSEKTNNSDDSKTTAKNGDDAEKNSAQLRVYNVLAPVDGQVLTILQGNEQTVPAGTPFMRIGNPDEMEIVVDLLSRDAVRVQTGAKAFIDQWGGEGTLNAEVVRVEPTGFPKVSALGIVEQRVKVVLDLKDDREKWRRLGHDFHVQIHIVVWSAKDIVTVPVSALFRRGDGWAVFYVEDGRARFKSIEIGHRNQRHAQVKTGLSSGDQVILYPSDKIRDGVRVANR